MAVESERQRSLRVERRLGRRVTRAGALLPHRSGRGILVTAPSIDRDSETFIRTHMESLPGRVSALFGTGIQAVDDESVPLVPRRWRLVARVARRFPAFTRLQDMIVNRWFTRFVAARDISVVLAEYGPIAVDYLGACKQARLPLVVHFHGYDAYSQGIITQLREAYARLFEQSAAIVVVSKAMKDKLIDMGAPRAKIAHIPCGANVNMFRKGAPELRPPVFVAAGRFVEKKAPHLTILAFRTVVDAVPEARLVMIGDGPLLGACRQLAIALELADRIDFRGATSHREVAQSMATARAFVQHSMRAQDGDSEGTPVAILEAAAAGLPVISTEHGGIPDVVTHERTGFLVEEGDVRAMARRMIQVAQEPELAGRLGRAGALRATEHYSSETAAARLWDVLDRAAGRFDVIRGGKS